MTRRNIPATTVAVAASAAGVRASSDARINGVSDDSRTIEPGDLFFCVRGASTDGHDRAPEAIASGAAALVVDRVLDVQVPQIVVPDVRAAVGTVVSALLGHPSRRVTMVGITGTNGKTSTVSFVASLLESCGHTPFVIGTLTGTRTTPEPIELQSLLADAVDAGHTHCVMEVSSHAMTLQRVNGIIFDVCGFTNLGHDHLDFHGTMEAYFAAKASLFAPDRCRIAVVNTDDPYGAALSGNPGVAHVDVRSGSLADVQVGAAAVSFRWRGHPCSARAGGVFSVPNLHLALEVCAALGEDPAALAEATRSVEAPAGRFESVATGGDYDVVVDYAHTPEALSGLLASARALATGRVIVVFGCGGDRDAAKRPEMGRVSAELADVVIITSDNPRSEDPARIIAEIVAGAKSGTARVMTEENRADAIASAISGAGSGDIVVIAGKGHESHQEVNGRSLRFSDVETARDAVRRKAGNP